jgi:hypothetical protein
MLPEVFDPLEAAALAKPTEGDATIFSRPGGPMLGGVGRCARDGGGLLDAWGLGEGGSGGVTTCMTPGPKPPIPRRGVRGYGGNGGALVCIIRDSNGFDRADGTQARPSAVTSLSRWRAR